VKWTPLHIEIFLHYATKADKLPMLTPVWESYRTDLIHRDLISAAAGRESGYVLTKRGEVWLGALLSTPLPEWAVTR
jgi:hypothetical protein